MIWYLLYPFRGTTDAPVLASSHPLRVAFTRYGTYAARHVVATLLISVAVACALIYPIPFLYSNDFTNGASNLPHHVWTNAQPLAEGGGVEPDVIMRSIWVHGSYMKALEPEVLLGALELQDELLGPTNNFSPRRPNNSVELKDPVADLLPDDRDTFHVINGLTNQSWFFHSPLQYWSCDKERIGADQDIVGTVNEKKKQPTSVNVTLRHSVVFSGKRFEDRGLLAADALVITLIHLRDSPVGRQWERKSRELADAVNDKWTLYPRDGQSMPSQLYEFQFLPISMRDSVLLALAYSITFLYFMLSLSKLRAVKSKPGLILTVVVQMFASIMSSFTMCAIFKIDLSRMPQAAYPIVVVSMSLENMFRLINAVLATRSEEKSGNPVGLAYGQTAHTALASVAQYLLVLWALSNVVPLAPISSFCAFAAIATVLDFFYLSTFFLAVLSVEVQRMELSEALQDKSTLKQKRASSQARSRQSWAEAVLQGKTDVSTRIAGIIVMLGTVMIAQWHFFDDPTVIKTLRRLLHLMVRASGQTDTLPGSPLLVEVHQARSPTSWLRLQDHETAREVIHVIKPLAHSYVARVFDPLVFVLKGSDRMPSVDEPVLLPAVYDFVRHQSKPFLVTVLVVVAAVRILMNYLLWDERSEAKADSYVDERPFLSVKTMEGRHRLDVALMTASTHGQVVSAGIDRMIQVLDIRTPERSHTVSSGSQSSGIQFPVYAMAIDDGANWLAILSAFSVVLWDLNTRRQAQPIPVDLCGQRPEAFFFTTASRDAAYTLILVRRNGTMVELWPESGDYEEYPVCKSPLVCAVPMTSTSTLGPMGSPNTIITASRRGCIHRVTSDGRAWTSEEVHLPGNDGGHIHSLLGVPLLSAYLVGRSRSVDLVDQATSAVRFTFTTELLQPRSLKFFHSSKRHTQLGATGLGYFTLAYTSAVSGDCVLQTYLPPTEEEVIGLNDSAVSSGLSCCPWDETRGLRRRIENPGVWEALPNGCVVGVRRKLTDHKSQHSPTHGPGLQDGLRHRGLQMSPPQPRPPDAWEVWSTSQLDKEGAVESTPLIHDAVEAYSHLLVSQLGPMVKVGTGSVAVGFGNVVKVVTIGQEHFGSAADILEADGFMGVGSRRRRTTAMSKQRAYLRG